MLCLKWNSPEKKYSIHLLSNIQDPLKQGSITSCMGLMLGVTAKKR